MIPLAGRSYKGLQLHMTKQIKMNRDIGPKPIHYLTRKITLNFNIGSEPDPFFWDERIPLLFLWCH